MLLNMFSLSALLGLTFALPIPLEVTERNTPLNDLLSAILAAVPGISGDINDLTSTLTNAELVIGATAGVQTTFNELGGACTAYTMIFARGTSEPGNVGVFVGPPLFDALGEKVDPSTITIQGVNNYEATVPQYLAGGDPVGSSEMASQITSALSACPNTKLVASGYSQGGQLVHNAIGSLPAATAAKISSVVIFGDPDSATPVANVDSSKVLIICHDGDDICQDGDFIGLPHLTYSEDAEQAADFIVAA